MSEIDLGERMTWNVSATYTNPEGVAFLVMRCSGCTARGARCRMRSGWLLLSKAPLEWTCRWHS